MFGRLNGVNSKMEAEGKDDLKVPLLQPSDSVAVSLSEPTPKRVRKSKTVKFKIGGIKCASCGVSIESALGKLQGVESVAVSAIQGQAVIRYIPESINVSQL